MSETRMCVQCGNYKVRRKHARCHRCLPSRDKRATPPYKNEFSKQHHEVLSDPERLARIELYTQRASRNEPLFEGIRPMIIVAPRVSKKRVFIRAMSLSETFRSGGWVRDQIEKDRE